MPTATEATSLTQAPPIPQQVHAAIVRKYFHSLPGDNPSEVVISVNPLTIPLDMSQEDVLAANRLAYTKAQNVIEFLFSKGAYSSCCKVETCCCDKNTKEYCPSDPCTGVCAIVCGVCMALACVGLDIGAIVGIALAMVNAGYSSLAAGVTAVATGCTPPLTIAFARGCCSFWGSWVSDNCNSNAKKIVADERAEIEGQTAAAQQQVGLSVNL